MIPAAIFLSFFAASITATAQDPMVGSGEFTYHDICIGCGEGMVLQGFDNGCCVTGRTGLDGGDVSVVIQGHIGSEPTPIDKNTHFAASYTLADQYYEKYNPSDSSYWWLIPVAAILFALWVYAKSKNPAPDEPEEIEGDL